MTRFGYACISDLLGLTTGHTCRLASVTPDRLRSLIDRNLANLAAILEHNRANGWRLFRIGSGVIPYGSHPANTLDWEAEFAPRLAAMGRFALCHGMRLSMHPGQYTVLNSPNPDVRRASVDELAYATRLLDALGLPAEHKIVLHVGGVYGDKTAAMARFAVEANRLPEAVRRRLVIENDDRHYTLADTLALSDQTGLPVVFDNLHDRLNPSSASPEALLSRVFATWGGPHGVPKVHFSSQAAGERPGKHADGADPVEFRAMLDLCSRFGAFDLMLEAKRKDAALRDVLAHIGARHGVSR